MRFARADPQTITKVVSRDLVADRTFQSFIVVLEAWEKSLSSIVLSEASTSTQASQT